MLRFAPSPTGDMHIGNLRVAILNYIVAKQQHKPFLVRIEDHDKEQTIEGKDTEIMQILEKFAIQRDLVYHQSEHLNIHQTLAIKLLKEGKAFICRCTPDEIAIEQERAKANGIEYRYGGICETLTHDDYQVLKEKGEPFVIRLKKPTGEIVFNDLIQGSIATSPDTIDSFVIMRTDNTPSHNFATACDDMLSNIDWIICEADQLSDTPKQIHIKKMLGYEAETQYAHLPIMVNEKEYSLQWLLEEGFVPDAILNYLILLGNTKAPQEIFTLPEAIEWFDLSAITTANFDLDRLRLINRKHLKMMEDKALSRLFGFADADIGKLAKVYLKEVSTIKELESKIRMIFTPKDFNGEWGESMRTLEQIIFDAPPFETFDEFKNHIMQTSGLTEENLLKPLSILLTGTENDTALGDIYPYIKSYLLEVAS